MDLVYETETFFMVFEILAKMKLVNLLLFPFYLTLTQKTSITIKVSHTAIIDFLIEELKVPDHKVERFLELLKYPNELINKTSVIEEMIMSLELPNCPTHKTCQKQLFVTPLIIVFNSEFIVSSWS